MEDLFMDLIDLRSDTVTKPTPEMRRAMAEAEVGDDVLQEDPTINRLQEIGAAKLGKEAALFVPSGTMGNLISVLAQCGRGDEVILGNSCHTYLFEAGGIAALGGVHPFSLPNQPDGTLELDAIRNSIRAENIHFPVTRLIMLENTHNRCGGVALTSEYTQAVGHLAHKTNIALHIDGARIFNAAAATGTTAMDLAAPADSITFCLSKGLCAPAGSLICGETTFIDRARWIRKQLGGGMRQAGILAAAGIVALDRMVDRLVEDHLRARRLAESLAEIKGVIYEMGLPQTNMIFLTFGDEIKLSTAQILAGLRSHGILASAVKSRQIRMVTHYWIKDNDIERTIQAFHNTLEV
jgi:threonine aldolase